MQHIDDPTTPIGPYSPYMNTSAEIRLAASALLIANSRLVWGEPGQPVTTTSGLSAPNTVAWPGEYVGDTLFNQSSKSSSTLLEQKTKLALKVALHRLAPLNYRLSPWLFKNGDTLYFPGKTTKVQFYDAGDSQFKDEAGGHGYVPGTDGAIVVTLSPGLPFKPGKITTDSATDTDQKNCWGLVIYEGNLTPKQASSRMRVQEVVVRRKRKKTLLL